MRMFDAYTWKARWMPAFIALVPAFLLIYPSFELSAVAGTLVSVTALAAFVAVAVEVTRTRGRRLETRLIAAWDGLPTTRGLRKSSGDVATKQRRKALSAMTGKDLPTRNDEEHSKRDADKRYSEVVRVAIVKIRSDQRGSDLLQPENVSYGFRRNVRALKLPAMVILCFTMPLTVVGVLWWSASLIEALFSFAVQAGLAVFWLFVVHDEWVREQADRYAERFFAVLEAHQ